MRTLYINFFRISTFLQKIVGYGRKMTEFCFLRSISNDKYWIFVREYTIFHQKPGKYNRYVNKKTKLFSKNYLHKIKLC